MKDFVFVESNTTGSGKTFLEASRRLGFRPVLMTRRPEFWQRVSDIAEVVPADTLSLPELLRECENFDVAAVWSSADPCMGMSAALASALGLPGPNPEATSLYASKENQRRAILAAGLKQPAWQRIHDGDALVTPFDFPVVAKPVQGSGKVGVLFCVDEATLNRYLAEYRGSDVLVEEFSEGCEFSVEMFDGRAVAIVRKHSRYPSFLETGHDVPANLAQHEQCAIVQTCETAARSLGLDWGPLHIEAKLSPEGLEVTIIEINLRLAGGEIPRLIHESVGHDLVELTVRKCLGQQIEEADMTPAVSPCVLRFFEGETEGRFVRIDGLADARSIPGVKYIGAFKVEGDVYSPGQDFRSRIGVVLAAGGTVTQAENVAHKAISLLQVIVDPIGAENGK